MHVLATAGHVDHGKSTLVRALTGMEPDRLAEERRRGMTIDLGYAWTSLPGGEEIAFVDVPGHERFIANMLTGLGPAPAVMFVVAADEGWSRQSDEHLAAIHALDLRHGLLAVTRSDLADPTVTRKESLDRIRRSSLGEIDSVTVSGTTGEGLDQLRAALSRLVATLPQPDRAARVRLWIDRAFTVRGSGTVVTGTLSAGSVAVGDELQLGSTRVVVRGVQSLGQARDRVDAVARIALNLRGVSTSALGRGDVLLSPGRWHHTTQLDVRLDTTDDLPNGLILHVGTAALPAHLRPLGNDTLGNDIVRITLPAALPLLAGDRGVLRDPSRHCVAAGVLVLDADPPTLSRRGAARRRAVDLTHATGRPDPIAEIARRGVVRRDHLQALGIVPDDKTDIGDIGDARDEGGWLVTLDTWRRWVEQAPVEVRRWAEINPLDPRMPAAVLRRALGLPDDTLLDPVLAETDLIGSGGRVYTGTESALPRSLGPAEGALRAVEQRLLEHPFAAPERNDLAALRLGRRELAAAENVQRLLRISDDIVLLPSAPDLAATALRALPQPFTTSQARLALDTTRRVAIPLLEYLDRTGRTEPVDEQRRRVRD